MTLRPNRKLPTTVWLGPILCGLLLGACGERNSRELEDIDPNLASSSDSTASVGGFVVSGQQPAPITSATNNLCVLDLKQDVIINPKGSVIKAIFSNKVVSLSDCENEGKKPVLYISSPAEFGIDPAYECKVQPGEYNVRCAGRLVKFTDSGNFQLSIAGDGQFDSSKIRMRVTFEAPASSPN